MSGTEQKGRDRLLGYEGVDFEGIMQEPGTVLCPRGGYCIGEMDPIANPEGCMKGTECSALYPTVYKVVYKNGYERKRILVR